MLRRLLGLLLRVVMSSLRGGTRLGLKQVLNQELIVIVDFFLGPLRADSQHGSVGLCFRGGGMIWLRLGTGASGVREALGG